MFDRQVPISYSYGCSRHDTNHTATSIPHSSTYVPYRATSKGRRPRAPSITSAGWRPGFSLTQRRRSTPRTTARHASHHGSITQYSYPSPAPLARSPMNESKLLAFLSITGSESRARRQLQWWFQLYICVRALGRLPQCSGLWPQTDQIKTTQLASLYL
jgi:hypothetical protein